MFYYTYMVRCEDNSLYTGMTSDLEKRINEHISKARNGAKYTKSHNAVKLEYQIKQLNKKQKEKIVLGERISTFLSGKVDCRRYRIEKINKKTFLVS